MKRFAPVVLTKRTANLDSFPFAPIYAIGNLPLLRKETERARQKISRSYFAYHRKILRELRVPLLHSHFGQQALIDGALARDLKIRHIATFYGADIWEQSTRAQWRTRFARLAAEADLFLVEGNAMRNKVLELGGRAEAVEVLHLGVDLSRIPFVPRAPDADGTVRILMAGRAIEKKGHIYGLMAFEKLSRKYPQLRLNMIVGRSVEHGEWARAMRDFIAEKNLASRVNWVEFMSYGDYLERLPDAHIFLQPSIHGSDGDAEGGFPVTILELAASGAPIVATTHCDIPEAVLDEWSGLLADEKDVDGLIERLDFLLQNPQLWPAFGAAGRAHVEKEYNIETQVGHLENHYARLLKSS